MAPQWRTPLRCTLDYKAEKEIHQVTPIIVPDLIKANCCPHDTWVSVDYTSNTLGWCSQSDLHPSANHVHLQEKQPPLPQSGGLLLPSVRIFLRLTLLRSPLVHILSGQRGQRRGDRDWSDPSSGAWTGFTGEKWGVGCFSWAERKGGGGEDGATGKNRWSEWMEIIVFLFKWSQNTWSVQWWGTVVHRQGRPLGKA